MWLQYDEEKGMGCLWCVEDKRALVAQNVLNSNRFIDGCNSYKNGVNFIVIWHPKTAPESRKLQGSHEDSSLKKYIFEIKSKCLHHVFLGSKVFKKNFPLK